jgi:type II secretory pathway pseudopilin PulG
MMKHRPGITLVEVLVAIFIMGIGMIALLTLFPLGALNIARALKDDRAAQAAANATAYADAMKLRHDGNIVGAFKAQNAAGWQATTAPSAPIYVDPFYVRLAAGKLGGVIQRVRPGYAAPPGGSNDRLEQYWFSLLDDLNFDTNGLPITTPGATPTVQRTGRYTWAYMLRRPSLGDEQVVDMTVVVYADRSLDVASGETKFAATFAVAAAPGQPNGNTVTYTSATPPKLRNGGWILDITTETATGQVHGRFYRVVDIADNQNGTFTLELQTPVAGNFNPGGAGTIVIMENVLEVFERGTGYVP